MAFLTIWSLLLLALCASALDVTKRPVCSHTMGPATQCKTDAKNFVPTQMSIGRQYAIRDKLDKVNNMTHSQLKDYLHGHEMPIVIYKDQLYLLDHHHLSWAMVYSKWESQGQLVYCTVICNYGDITEADFIKKMEAQHWLYLKDNFGKDITPSQLPKTIPAMLDDPYRSLSGFVKYHGFEKNCTYFSEFDWANFYRDPLRGLKPEDSYYQVMTKFNAAVTLSREPSASKLPGYVAPPTPVTHNKPDCKLPADCTTRN